MERFPLFARSAVTWVLLASFSFPVLPADARELPAVRLPASYNSATASERAATPEPGTRAEDDTALSLHLVIVKGDGAVNNLKKKITVAPVVRVLDNGDRPVSGAVVTLTAPDGGASVEFAHGTHSTMLVSDSDGLVQPAELTAVNTGSFVYKVRALFQEQEAIGTIAQTNVANTAGPGAPSGQPATATTAHGFPHWAYAALIGGGAAAAGIGIAMAMKGGSKTSTSPTSATIGSPGSVSVGH